MTHKVGTCHVVVIDVIYAQQGIENMKRPHLDVRLTEKEQQKIREKYQGQNISEIIRIFLLGDQAEPREPRERKNLIATINP